MRSNASYAPTMELLLPMLVLPLPHATGAAGRLPGGAWVLAAAPRDRSCL